MNGRKRHLLVDTAGLLLKALVHPASLQDATGARLLLAECHGRFPRLGVIWGDAAYRGVALREFARVATGARLEAVDYPLLRSRYRRPTGPGAIQALRSASKRWVVERTFAWEGRNRRLSKDYEGLPETEEAWLYIGMYALMLRRLTKP